MIEAEGVFVIITCVSIMCSYPGIVNICLKNYLNIDIIRHILRNIDTVVVVCKLQNVTTLKRPSADIVVPSRICICTSAKIDSLA